MKNTVAAVNSVRNRIDVVDALRGFAIMTIMLFHNVEHFDLIYFPENLPVWLKDVDSKVWVFLDFFVAGKAYAIFALLFGFTFYLMDKKQKDQGADFRFRFLWRLLLLLMFGILNSAFYEGDILTIYAIMGVSLVFICRLSDRAILMIAAVLLLQPVALGNFLYLLIHPEYILPANHSDFYFGQAYSYMTGPSFLDLVKGNLTNGKWAVLLWTWEKGRIFQAPALFMIGFLMGRRHLFSDVENKLRFWRRTLAISSFFVLFFLVLKSNSTIFGLNEHQADPLNQVLYSWSNLAMLMVLVSLFILLYRRKKGERVLSTLIPFGRMSLTNYVMQSILGATIYYGFGFGFYSYTGATYSVLVGIILFLVQLLFCKWWLRHHKQGPLEFFWHKATWIKLNIR